MAHSICNEQMKILSWASSAEEIVGNLDILIEILLRLPARSLIRFKSVSKQWHLLISGTEFPPKHISLNPKPIISGLYLEWDTYPIPIQGHSLPTLTFLGVSQKSLISGRVKYKFHDSRHGLILCSLMSFRKPQIMVCNPTTQKCKVFHQRELNLQRQIPETHFYLYFNPSISLIYKLILIRDIGSHLDISICASNCSFWKTISIEAEQTWGRCPRHGVLSSNGIIYMITGSWYLVEFDVETEKLSVSRMNLAPNMDSNSIIGYFGECGDGNLVLIVANMYRPDFAVYEMDRQMEGRDWVLKHIINPGLEIHNLPEIRCPLSRNYFAVMWVFWDGKDHEKDLNLVLGIPKKAILYNHRSKKTQVICDLPGRNQMDWETTYLDVHPFIGSLCVV